MTTFNDINDLGLLSRALVAADAVPAKQDECWPSDGPAHDEDCTLADHAASRAAVVATEGLSWEFSSWSATADQLRERIADIALIAAAKAEWSESDIADYIEAHDENNATPEAQLLAMFRSIYGRNPEGREERLDMWSHICCGVSHA